MKKFISVFTVFFALLVLPLPLAAEINLLSPVEGQFANRQMLVIDNSEGGDFFYSIDGANPETFGFAYDGPVLLDVTGEINLNVTKVAAGGKKESTSLTFTVVPDDASKTDYKNFIQTFFDGGLLNYSAGSDLVIPAGLSFYLGLPPANDMPENFIPARTLKLSSASVLSRYIPCTVLDQTRGLRYRFIIKTYPQSAGIYSHRDVPFSITDWDTINFDDDDFIYKLDSEYWGLPKEPRKIDRSVSHMISWQPLEYDSGNPIEFFVLPPKPEIIREQLSDGSILCSIRGDDSYSLGIIGEDGSCSELFSQVGIDAFYGDQVSGSLSLGIFSNSVYQGKFTFSYNVNRRPPQIPLIKTNADSFVSRDNVDVKIQGSAGADLYIALSEPLTLDITDVSYSADDERFKRVSLGEYKKVKGDSFTLRWAQNGLKPVYYKVSAYSKSDENQSLAAEFAVVIDQSNYYFDAGGDAESADGTASHPFTQFSQLAPALVKQRVVKLNVKGEMQINEAYPVQANFEIINSEDARISFGPKGSLIVKASTMELSGCRIHNTADLSVKSIVPLFKLENSVLTMKDCMIGAEFTRNGTVIDATNGIVNISDTIASANAVSYVSFISSVKSRITIKNSSISANAETGVIISADGGNVTAQKNEFLVTGGNGRIAELFGVNASFKENSFKARLTNTTSKIQPIYVNKATKLTDEKNSVQGF
jgi:hypothetical protein